jgi:uncharacterized protein (DUF302 family)
MPVRALIALLVFHLVAAPLRADDDSIAHYAATARFADVRDDIAEAIAVRGLVIDHTSHVGAMLERTGKDLGATREPFKSDEAQVLSFCSSVLSRRTMEADPLNIVFCPYTLAVYSTPDEPGTVHVVFRRPRRANGDARSDSALRDVENLLDGIAREALHLAPR